MIQAVENERHTCGLPEMRQGEFIDHREELQAAAESQAICACARCQCRSCVHNVIEENDYREALYERIQAHHSELFSLGGRLENMVYDRRILIPLDNLHNLTSVGRIANTRQNNRHPNVIDAIPPRRLPHIEDVHPNHRAPTEMQYPFAHRQTHNYDRTEQPPEKPTAISRWFNKAKEVIIQTAGIATIIGALIAALTLI
jgi:hypothetical protein